MSSLSASNSSLVWARVLRLIVPWFMAGASALSCGAAVAYAPNALGQPTQLGAYASVVSHHPNGAIAGYTLGNGVVHSVSQNTRGLPLVWRDAGVIQDQYSYDANGNLSAITDQQEAGATSRAMGYDGLDRLTSANGLWGAGSFAYDPLDNLRVSTVGTRTLTHSFDASNRMTGVAGSINMTLGYDANGNLNQRGPQAFSFDIGNRLTSATGKASYLYDGLGRRTKLSYADGSTKLQLYSQAGKLLYSSHSTQGVTYHGYLGSQLIVEVNSLTGDTYAHTDALGSPVAKTNTAATILNRTRYEPYGGTAAGTNPTGIGFTGHVSDADTGLVYMQQRYYEPYAARFMSVDPVTTDASTGGHFNRYVYARNNPYRYVDPNGEQAVLAGPAAIGGTFVCGPICGAVAGGVVLVGGTYLTERLASLIFSEAGSDSSSSDSGKQAAAAAAPTAAEGAAGIGKGGAGNTNPYKGPVNEPVVVVDQNGNAIPVAAGQSVGSSGNGDYQQVLGADGKPTGDRMDRGGHKGQKDPKAQGPHGHRPGVNTPAGNPHLPINPPKVEPAQ